MHVALTMETCAQVYVQSLALGTPAELPNEAVAAGRKMFEARWKIFGAADRRRLGG